MFGTISVILDSRREVFDRIITEDSLGSKRLHSNAQGFRHATGVGAAISELSSNQVDTLFVHSLDCDETKLVEGLRQLPQHKLPRQVVVFGAYPNLSDRISVLLEMSFNGQFRTSKIPGDI